jgi:phospholipid/cholesterol/gamma-HCH transport system substrate-binding protein
MKLMIRFADKIVGGFIILALGILIFVIFMLGSTQRWFSRDYQFRSYFTSASGLSPNMAVQFKGFTIGNVKSIRLAEDDRVEVIFTIFDTYIDRVRFGSLVEVQVSPIGMGGQFLFHPGLGEELIDEGETIPVFNSSEAARLLAMGVASRPEEDDSISSILNSVNTLLGLINEAFEGTDQSSLGRIIGDIEATLAGVRNIIEELPGDLVGIIEGLVAQIEPTLANIQTLSDTIVEPGSTVMALLDSERELYTGLAASIDAVSGILQNLEKTTDFIPAQLPQIIALIADLHSVLITAEEVLISLTNNPLLRRGVPQRPETRAGGAHPRDLEF